jgi:hypothetical protein
MRHDFPKGKGPDGENIVLIIDERPVAHYFYPITEISEFCVNKCVSASKLAILSRYLGINSP